MTPFFRILLDSSLRISIVAAAVAITLLAARVRSGAVRHAAWLAVLCAMLLMPVLSRVTPAIDVPLSTRSNATAMNTPSPETAPSPAEPPSNFSPPKIAATPALTSGEHHQASWSTIAFFVYSAGLAALLCRLLLGWLAVRRVLRASTRMLIQGAPVYQSPLVSVPVSVGLLSQKIVLPPDWSAWPEAKLRAVLAHELAHAHRRDTITNLLAHINRSLFWFHPLAWWLERQLSLTAEQACDDAAVHAIGERRGYAEVLLDMAETVRRRGARLACPGVGLDGTGLLGRRIDRLLSGAAGRVTRPQRALVALTCAAAIFLAAACRDKSPYSVELKPDPKNAETLARQDTVKAAMNMDANQVAELEAAVRRNPEDLESRRKLMTFYQANGRKVLGDEKTIAAFWPHKLWCIEHHPEDPCASMAPPLSDAAYDEQARKLWLAVLRRKDVAPAALLSAAAFFERTDPAFAEKIILSTPISDKARTDRLARLYATALAGPDAQGPYAQEVRKKLEETKDAALLASVGYNLAIWRRAAPDASAFETLGRSYLQRALALDPNSAEADDKLQRLQQIAGVKQFVERLYATVDREPSEKQYQQVSALSEPERFQFLPFLAERAYMSGDSLDYYKHDPDGARKDWELARRYAQDALRLAPRFTFDPNYGNSIYRANMTMGMVAMRVDGDKKSAREYLLAAGSAQTTDNQVEYFTLKLPVVLLKYGGAEDRKAVIEFLESHGKTLHRPDLNLLASAEELREGLMPIWYQYQAAQLK